MMMMIATIGLTTVALCYEQRCTLCLKKRVAHFYLHDNFGQRRPAFIIFTGNFRKGMQKQWFIQTPQGGVITPPQFSCDTPPTIWSSGGLSGGCFRGVYVIVMEGVINMVKYWHEPIYLLYETNNAQNLVILFSGIMLKLLPPDVIFCS